MHLADKAVTAFNKNQNLQPIISSGTASKHLLILCHTTNLGSG